MRGVLWVLVVMVALAGLPQPAVASSEQTAQLRPINLGIYDDRGWQAENDFAIAWDEPPIASHGFPVTAVDWRLRDWRGAVVSPEFHRPEPVTRISQIHLPGPGLFVADVWLRGPDGERGPMESVALRFDDVPPAPTQPVLPAGWVAGDASVWLGFAWPLAPLPASGIRGYAFSVGRGDDSFPCAGPGRCTLAETDLRRGMADDSAWLGTLPEGPNVVRAVAVSGSGVRSEPRSATVWVDATRPEVTLDGVPGGWSSGPVRLTARATDALSGMAGGLTAIAIDGGLPTVAAGDTVSATVSGPGIHPVSFYGRDSAGNSGEDIARMAMVRIDETPPRVSFVNRQDPAEPERIEVEVVDPLAGPSPERGTIAVRRAGSRARFEPLPTTISAGRLVARWDSDSFPTGPYEFRATGFDAAGNTSASERRGNGSPMQLLNPLKAPTKTEAGFGGRHLVWNRCTGRPGHRRCRQETIESFADRPTHRTVPYGRALSISGRLTNGDGAALAGAPVMVVETFDPGAALAVRSLTIQTAADGTFSARLAPGPGRRVEAFFAGDRLRGRSAAPSLRLDVQAGVRLSASARVAVVGGPPILFRGRVGDLDAPHPAGGRPVELQFRVPGGEWSEFRTVQTDRHGRFRYPYSFNDDDSRGVRFQFRALAPAVAGWPYEPGTSRPLLVTGR